MNWIERESEIGVKKCPNDVHKPGFRSNSEPSTPYWLILKSSSQSETLAPCSVLFFTFSSVMECKLLKTRQLVL